MNMTLCSNPTRYDAEEWYFRLIRYIGAGFHPDTDAADYIDLQTGKLLFSKKQAEEINSSLDVVFDTIPDPYKLGLPVVQDLLLKRLQSPVIERSCLGEGEVHQNRHFFAIFLLH